MTPELARHVLGATLLAGGAVFMLAAAVAVLRLPDALSRLHGVTKAETAGLFLTLAGAVTLAPSWRFALIALAAWAATAAAGAAAAHLIAGAALRRGPGS